MNKKKDTDAKEAVLIDLNVCRAMKEGRNIALRDSSMYEMLKNEIQDDIKKEIKVDFDRLLTEKLEVAVGNINANINKRFDKAEQDLDSKIKGVSGDIEKSEHRVLDRFDDTKDDIKDIRDKLYVLQGQKIDRIEATNRRRTIMMTIGLLISWLGLILSHIDKITAFFN